MDIYQSDSYALPKRISPHLKDSLESMLSKILFCRNPLPHLALRLLPPSGEPQTIARSTTLVCPLIQLVEGSRVYSRDTRAQGLSRHNPKVSGQYDDTRHPYITIPQSLSKAWSCDLSLPVSLGLLALTHIPT